MYTERGLPRGYRETESAKRRSATDETVRSQLEMMREVWSHSPEKMTTPELTENDEAVIQNADAMVNILMDEYAIGGRESRPEIGPVRFGSPHADIHGGIFIERDEDSSCGDALMFMEAVHEKIHEASYQAVTVGSKVDSVRSGFVFTDSAGKKFFKGMNEAIVSSLEKEAVWRLPEDHPYKKALTERFDKYKGILKPPYDTLPGLSPFDIHISENLKEGKVSVSPSYTLDRYALNVLFAGMADHFDEGFESVRKTFITASFSGDWSAVKKYLREYLGPKGMQIMSLWDTQNPQETKKQLQDYFHNPTNDGAERLLLILQERKCQTCGENTVGSACSTCGSPLPQ